MNFRRSARQLDLHHQPVIHWITAAADQVPDRPPPPDRVETVALDEFDTGVGTKKNGRPA